MASNPMQRKARNAFLLGFIISLIIAAVGIYYFYSKYSKLQEEIKEKENVAMGTVYVTQSAIQSGGRLKSNLMTKTVPTELIPANAATINDLGEYITAEQASEGGIVDMLPDQIVSKINLEPGTILTKDMIANIDGLYTYKKQEGDKVTIETNPGIRIEEYNMLSLPSKLKVGDYIDIRLQLPTGPTFIVVSKKYVEDANATTVWLAMSEEEILAMNNAIVETYQMTGAKLYADIYVESGMQRRAETTYIPSANVSDLIMKSPDVIQTAKDSLQAKYNNPDTQKNRNEYINKDLEKYEDEQRLQNTEQGVAKEIEDLREARQLYLDELGEY